MSIELDKKIGRLVYSWSEKETPQNNWYDPWAQLWRPSPTFDKTATPAFSTSVVDALQLVEALAHQGIETNINYDGIYLVRMCGENGYEEACSASLPDAISKCVIALKETYENIPQFPAPAIPQALYSEV